MTLIQLESLVALDRHRNFVRAADQVAITQPALSMQMQQLEAELGVKLFDRSRKPLAITEAGAVVVAQARQVLAQVRQLRQAVGGLQTEMAGALRLAAIPTVAPYLVPLFLPRWLQAAPKVELQVSEALTSEVLQALTSDAADVGIVVTPLAEVPTGLRVIPLYYERFYAYVSPLSALSQLAELSPEDLSQAPLVLLREGNCFRAQALNLCGVTSRSVRFRYEGHSLEALRQIVDRVEAVTLLPELAVRGLRQLDQERSRPLGRPQFLREVSLVVRASYPKTALLELLVEVIKDEMNQYVPLYAELDRVVATS